MASGRFCQAALIPPLRNFPAGEPQLLPNEGNLRAGIGRTGVNADADSTVGAVGDAGAFKFGKAPKDRKHEGSPWACSGLKTRCSLTNSTCSPLRVRASTSDRSVGAKSPVPEPFRLKSMTVSTKRPEIGIGS